MKINFSPLPTLEEYKLDLQQAAENKLLKTDVEYAARIAARTALYLLELGMPVPFMNKIESKKVIKDVLEHMQIKLKSGLGDDEEL
jgi:hypothetical protein